MSTTVIEPACQLVTTVTHQGHSVGITVVGVPGPAVPGTGGGPGYTPPVGSVQMAINPPGAGWIECGQVYAQADWPALAGLVGLRNPPWAVEPIRGWHQLPASPSPARAGWWARLVRMAMPPSPTPTTRV
ncbi:hypothetical protein MASR1M50_08920 [Burkholderiales bacterium]